jgi:DNA-binding NtrC family response regulator
MDILLVEGDASAASSIRKSVEEWGHKTEIARSARKALEKVSQRPYHIILLNISLPDGPGHSYIPLFKTALPEVGIITMTGKSTPELEKEARSYGLLYYMLKPVDERILKNLLDHYSERVRRE